MYHIKYSCVLTTTYIILLVTTPDIINNNQIPIDNNKNCDQKIRYINRHICYYQRTQKNERSRYPESKLHARKQQQQTKSVKRVTRRNSVDLNAKYNIF
jgi:hypothetical protein